MTETTAIRVTVPAALLAAAREEAAAILHDVRGVRLAVFATSDGFDIASCVQGALDPSRVAALASSIAAIGEVVSTETGLGASTSVTVNTQGGFAVVHAVKCGELGLVLQVVADRDAVLAQVNYRAAEAVRRLART